MWCQKCPTKLTCALHACLNYHQNIFLVVYSLISKHNKYGATEQNLNFDNEGINKKSYKD